MISKATAAAFERRARRVAIALGAVPADVYGDERATLHTAAGPLHVWPSCMPTRRKREGFFTVFCRFAQPERVTGPARDGMNPHSGKANFHWEGGNEDLAAAVAAFSAHLTKLQETCTND